MSVVVTQLFNGISLGSILILIAIGLAVTFGLMNIINMAHGELIMAGAYTTYVVQQLFLSYLPASLFSYYFLIAIIMAFAVAAFIGIVIEKVIVRRLYDRPLDSLLATWGVSLILQQAARSIFGAPNVAVKSPEWLTGGVTLFSVTFPYKRLFILALVLFTLALLGYYLFKTSAGRRMQAVTLSRSMASCLGVSVRKTDTLAFALGSGLYLYRGELTHIAWFDRAYSRFLIPRRCLHDRHIRRNWKIKRHHYRRGDGRFAEHIR